MYYNNGLSTYAFKANKVHQQCWYGQLPSTAQLEKNEFTYFPSTSPNSSLLFFNF